MAAAAQSAAQIWRFAHTCCACTRQAGSTARACASAGGRYVSTASMSSGQMSSSWPFAWLRGAVPAHRYLGRGCAPEGALLEESMQSAAPMVRVRGSVRARARSRGRCRAAVRGLSPRRTAPPIN